MFRLARMLVALAVMLIAATSAISPAAAETLGNAAYRLEVTNSYGGIHAQLFDKTLNLPLADGPYLYSAEYCKGGEMKTVFRLKDSNVSVQGDKLIIRGNWPA